MKFIEHGIFEVKIENNLLIVDATGPFNEELIISYQHALDSCIKILEKEKWNQIIVLHKLSLFTPEAEQALTNSLIARKLKGLQRSAVIDEDLLSKRMVMQQMSRCYTTAKIEHQFFHTLSDAKTWLNS